MIDEKLVHTLCIVNIFTFVGLVGLGPGPLRGLEGLLVDDDIPVEEAGGLVALDHPGVVADQRLLVELGALGAEEGPASAPGSAHVVNL